MSRKQLFTLFLCSLIQYTMGGSVAPLYPVYLDRLGIDPAVSGFFFAAGIFINSSRFIFSRLDFKPNSSDGGRDNFYRRAGWFARYVSSGPGQSHCPTNNVDASHLVYWRIGSHNDQHHCRINTAEPQERGRVFGILATAMSVVVA